MAGEHVTHTQLKEHIEPINRDIKNLIAEVSKSTASTQHIATTIQSFVTNTEPRIRALEMHSSNTKVYWKGVFWAGGLLSSGLVALAVAVLS